MDMAKAKQKLIHRYELMTKRVREIEPRDIYGNFLNAFARSLDPHSNYYPPEEVEDFEIQMSLSLDGIGVALSSRDGYSVVERMIPGGATDKAKRARARRQDHRRRPGRRGAGRHHRHGAARRGLDHPRQTGHRRSSLTVLRKGDTTERFEVEIVRDEVTIEDAAATLEFREVEVGGETNKLAILDLPTFYGDSDPAKRQSGRDVRDLLRQVREPRPTGCCSISRATAAASSRARSRSRASSSARAASSPSRTCSRRSRCSRTRTRTSSTTVRS